ncbi:unnamed protein product (mitochondrion) [Plasmodiophora brassicae]|uniref:Uncharacterized protein n=1 Tax=Plasmodiophora brassicae TaxID=37360 RepID=A0A0G4J553_PLABS|nr:hypothetical protein PBRA_009010 [Plasmodiophora brassicae]SPQ99915.1 unnamed protein product [Plasmodiophora brassicae]
MASTTAAFITVLSAVAQAPLPGTCSLPENRLLPIRFQGLLGMCTAFAMASCLEYFMMSRNNSHRVSVAFLHQIATHFANVSSGTHDARLLGRTGPSIEDMADAVQRYGFAFEEDYPFAPVRHVFDSGVGILPMPSDAVLIKARKWRLTGYTELCLREACEQDEALDRIRRAIHDGKPVVARIDWFSLGEPAASDGALHAVVIIAYRDDQFLIRNSFRTSPTLWKSSAVLKQSLTGAFSIDGVARETPEQAANDPSAYDHGIRQWSGKTVCIGDCHGTYLTTCGPGDGQRVAFTNEKHPYRIEVDDDGTCAIRSMTQGNYIRWRRGLVLRHQTGSTSCGRADTETLLSDCAKFKITGHNGTMHLQTWANVFLSAHPVSKEAQAQHAVDDSARFTFEPFPMFGDVWDGKEAYIRTGGAGRYLCLAGPGFGQRLHVSDRPCTFTFETQRDGKVAIRSVDHGNFVRCWNADVDSQTYIDRFARFTPRVFAVSGERRIAFQAEAGGYHLQVGADGTVVGAEREESFVIEEATASKHKRKLTGAGGRRRFHVRRTTSR